MSCDLDQVPHVHAQGDKLPYRWLLAAWLTAEGVSLDQGNTTVVSSPGGQVSDVSFPDATTIRAYFEPALCNVLLYLTAKVVTTSPPAGGPPLEKSFTFAIRVQQT